jgi:UDP-N-acetylglucosamine 4-epimerase
LIEGDIRDPSVCKLAVDDVDFVLHQAALGSVPLSLESPRETHDVNVTGFLNLLSAAAQADVSRFVYASSCAIYGDNPNLPLTESEPAKPLSPYAASKVCNEVYAEAFQRSYGIETVGLRYFNVFGERQDPNGAYAAVIPRWIDAAMRGMPIQIFGDGGHTRDFVYVRDVVRANVASVFIEAKNPGQVFNVAGGHPISLNNLRTAISSYLKTQGVDGESTVVYKTERPGDIRHSSASLERAYNALKLSNHDFEHGLKQAINWYHKRSDNQLDRDSEAMGP